MEHFRALTKEESQKEICKDKNCGDCETCILGWKEKKELINEPFGNDIVKIATKDNKYVGFVTIYNEHHIWISQQLKCHLDTFEEIERDSIHFFTDQVKITILERGEDFKSWNIEKKKEVNNGN